MANITANKDKVPTCSSKSSAKSEKKMTSFRDDYSDAVDGHLARECLAGRCKSPMAYMP